MCHTWGNIVKLLSTSTDWVSLVLNHQTHLLIFALITFQAYLHSFQDKMQAEIPPSRWCCISPCLDFYPCNFVLFSMLPFTSRRCTREHLLPRSSLDHLQSNWQWQICGCPTTPWAGQAVILQGYCIFKWGWHKVVSHPAQVLSMLQTRVTWILEMKIDIYRL